MHGLSSLSLELEEKYAEEVKSSLSNQIRSQLEEEVLAALELEVEEKLKEKVLQDLEAERQTLEDAKNQFQQEVGIRVKWPLFQPIKR